MGFTLRAALGALGPAARVEVAELIPAVAQWAGTDGGGFGAVSPTRASLVTIDVAKLMRAAAGRYDAILLDVDNGPEGFSAPPTTRSTTRAASPPRAPRCGRAACSRCGPPGPTADSPGGSTAGFATEKRARARGARGGARHVIWIATKPG